MRGAAILLVAALSLAPAAPPKPDKHVTALRADLARVFETPAIMARGTWGIDIRSLDTGEQLYSLNADKLMMPASNMKILTLAATAETLGWEYRFTTTLETTGTIENGTLHGDLIVKSNGDPTINARGGRADSVLQDWSATLKNAGVIAIDGRVVGDDSAFDDEGVGPGWAWDYLEAGYAAPSGALEFNENVAQLTITAAGTEGDPAVVVLSPGAGLSVMNHVTTTAAGVQGRAGVHRRIDQPILEVTGSIAVGAKPVVRDVAVVNPTTFFAQSLKGGLVARGISVSGPAVDLDDVAAQFIGVERQPLVSTQSPPLREIATVLMKVSQNLYAETLLKAVGASKGGIGTTRGGENILSELFGTWGVADDAFVMVDGSGLSRYDYVTPRSVTILLERMYKDPKHRDAFMSTLPIAGKDGTISTRMRKTRAEGNALAKTGSIANVRSLSGYVKTRDGEMLAFSILANDFVIPAATVNWIADLGVEILSNFTRK